MGPSGKTFKCHHPWWMWLLATACAAGSDTVEPGERVGTLEVVVTTTGPEPDPDGYLLTLDQGDPQTVSQTGTITLASIAEGEHTLELTGVAANCSPVSPNPQVVQVVARETAQPGFEVHCASTSSNTGAIRVSTFTTGTPGSAPGSDSYNLRFDLGAEQPIGYNDSQTFPGFLPGSHEVLLWVHEDCLVEGANPRELVVTAGGTVVVDFDVACSPPAPPPGSLEGRIVFSSNRAGPQDIYVMNADGTGAIQLTHDRYWDDNPTWSPDGTRIAFMSGRDGNADIYVMNADGSDQTRLTTEPEEADFPSWSPDGTRIVFRGTQDNVLDVYVINVDGTGLINLTNDDAVDEEPSWSPDGTKIAFSSVRNSFTDIYVMNADGSGQVNVTRGAAGESSGPAWSPDGTKIAFTGSEGDNYVMDADGSNQRRLTHRPELEFEPTWSPDGHTIAFTSIEVTGHKILVVNLDATGLFNLTGAGSGIIHNFSPEWGR